MLRPIAIIQKKYRFGLGYKPDKRGKQRYMKEKTEKRIATFLGKKKENAKIEIPPLSHTFRSIGFIIPEAIQGKDQEISVDEVFESLSITWSKSKTKRQVKQGYLYSRRDKFWIIGPLLNFPLSLSFQASNDHEQPGVSA